MVSARRAIKQTLAAGLHWSGARRLVAAARRHSAGGRRVLVFGYHRVAGDFEGEATRSIDSCIISRNTFARHITFLAEHFELATMSRALEVLTGQGRASRDLAVITFDDGYADVLENALPILADVHAPAMLYVSSGVIGKQAHFPHDRLYALLQLWERSESLLRGSISARTRTLLSEVSLRPGGAHEWLRYLIDKRTPAELDFIIADLAGSAHVPAEPPESTLALNWEGVRALAAAGWEIGSHTVGHSVLSHLSPAEMEKDLKASKAAIERAVRHKVLHFAYCNGYYNDAVIEALRRTSYASAVTTEDRLNHIGCDPYRIARRVLWEGSAMGALGGASSSLIACQLDDTWSALGFNASESGERPVVASGATALPARARRLA